MIPSVYIDPLFGNSALAGSGLCPLGKFILKISGENLV
mgnify:CR=1 FL=1